MEKIETLEVFKTCCEEQRVIKKEIEDPRTWQMIYNFVKLQQEILHAVEDHNKHFVDNEAFNGEIPEEVIPTVNLLRVGLIDGGKQGNIIAALHLDLVGDFGYMKELSEQFPISEDEFYRKLEEDGKIKKEMTVIKQRKLVYLWFKKYIAEPLQKLSNDQTFLDELSRQLSDSSQLQTLHIKLQNRKMFDGVIQDDNTTEAKSIIDYLPKINLAKRVFYEGFDKNLSNTFTRINNLFLKPPKGVLSDSVNAKSVFDSTMETNEEGIMYPECDLAAPKRMVFDCIDGGKSVRKGRYNIQASSDKMIVNKIQQGLIHFNEEMDEILKAA